MKVAATHLNNLCQIVFSKELQCPSYESKVFQIEDFAQSFGSFPFWSWWKQMEAEGKVASHGRNL